MARRLKRLQVIQVESLLAATGGVAAAPHAGRRDVVAKYQRAGGLVSPDDRQLLAERMNKFRAV